MTSPGVKDYWNAMLLSLIASVSFRCPTLSGEAIPIAPPTSEQAEAVRALSERYIKKGGGLEKTGDLKGAVLDFSEAIRVDPENPEAYVRRGKAKFAMGDSDGALSDFSDGIAADPEYAEAYFRRGLVRQEKADLEGALEDHDRAVNINPSRKEYFNGRGKLRFQVGDYARAAEDFDRFSMMDRGSVAAVIHRGLAHFYAGEFDKASEDYNKALKSKFPHPHAYYLRALLKFNSGLYEGAAIDLGKAINLRPDSGLYPLARGALFYGLGDHSGARSDFERSKAFSDDDRIVDNAVLWIWLVDGWMNGTDTANAKLQTHYKIREFEILDPWYKTIVDFLIGAITEDAFLQAAQQFPNRERDDRLSHAAFFAAQKRLLAKEKRKAGELLSTCVNKGHVGALEYQTARLQLGDVSHVGGPEDQRLTDPTDPSDPIQRNPPSGEL